ncbi:MAG: cupin domain-containing protein [Methylobacteriaceae bacterium]|nr:cupin domain-containing protein [Methylobacteriaceae bacterium]
MSLRHHPSDQALADYAAGTLDAGRALVVATHAALCPACRRTIRAFECVGGALLDKAEPTQLNPDALASTLKRLDQAHVDTAADPRIGNDEFAGPLSAYKLGKWKWLGPGVYRRSVETVGDGETSVFLLKAEPGTRLPHHTHSGPEWTCILQGAFRHHLGRYGPGDFDEADENVEHTPIVEAGEPCICVVALQGKLLLQGWVGRLMQPLVRL